VSAGLPKATVSESLLVLVPVPVLVLVLVLAPE